MKNYKQQLLDRLTRNSICICEVADSINHHPIGKFLTGQLVRSGTASSLIYAESISAESIKDLIHKLGLVLKELRETKTNLIILSEIKLNENTLHLILSSLKETDELIAQISRGLYTLKTMHRNRSRDNQ
jgi:four helix bundle protein